MKDVRQSLTHLSISKLFVPGLRDAVTTQCERFVLDADHAFESL
jgi:hypothetical protein